MKGLAPSVTTSAVMGQADLVSRELLTLGTQMANTNKSRFNYGKTGGLPAPRLGSKSFTKGLARPGYGERKVASAGPGPKVARPGWREKKVPGGGRGMIARPGYAEKISGYTPGK